MLETIFVLTLFALVISSVIVALGDILGKHTLISRGHEAVQILRESRMNSVTKNKDDKWGVYFDISADPDQYIFFKGDDYYTRDQSYDRVTTLSVSAYFSEINLAGGNAVIFEKTSGRTVNNGSVRIVSDTMRFNILINRLGIVNFNY